MNDIRLNLNIALMSYGARLLRALKTKIFCKYSNLASKGKKFSSLSRGLNRVSHFLSRIILAHCLCNLTTSWTCRLL